MLFAEQIRAARALLDWPTALLAQKTGLTINGLNKIERGHVSAQRETLEKIKRVFEDEGIEFLPGSGLRRKDDMIFSFEGPDSNRRLAQDVYNHLKDTGGELLIVYDDEDSADVYLDQDFMAEEFRKRKEANITHRVLSGTPKESRYKELRQTIKHRSDAAFSKYPIFIYGSRFALLSPEYAPKVIIVDNARIAQSARNLFNFIWDNTDSRMSDKGRKPAPTPRTMEPDNTYPTIISPEQIRAARAFLDWTTNDLAKQAGLTINGINKIERGHVTPQKETLLAIKRVFEEAGLELLPFSGVKRKEKIVQIWDDEDGPSRLLDDIFNELRDTGGEICVFGVDEQMFGDLVGKEKLQKHTARLARYGIFERLLVNENDTNLVGPPETYHQLPEQYFHPEPFCIYGSKLALVNLEDVPKIIIIDDIRMADSVQRLFDFVWDHTKPAAYPMRKP